MESDVGDADGTVEGAGVFADALQHVSVSDDRMTAGSVDRFNTAK
jgi:hypothetical protein